MAKKAMSKKDLVTLIAAASGSDRKTVSAVLDGMATVAAKAVAAGDIVALPGLGKLVVRERAEREVRNPATGDTVKKPADKVVKFLIAKSLKDGANA